MFKNKDQIQYEFNDHWVLKRSHCIEIRNVSGHKICNVWKWRTINMLQRSMSQLLLLRLLFDIATYVRCRLPICAHLCVPNFLIDITSSALQRVKSIRDFTSFPCFEWKIAKSWWIERFFSTTSEFASNWAPHLATLKWV